MSSVLGEIARRRAEAAGGVADGAPSAAPSNQTNVDASAPPGKIAANPLSANEVTAKNEAPHRDASAPPPQKISAKKNPAAKNQPDKNFPPPVPCPACGCPAVWQSVYDRGDFRCLNCSPPPGRSMVAARWWLITKHDGQPAWVPYGRDETALDDTGVASASQRSPDGRTGAQTQPITPEAAWARFWSHPRLIQHVASERTDDGAEIPTTVTYAIAPPGRDGDTMLKANRERERAREAAAKRARERAKEIAAGNTLADVGAESGLAPEAAEVSG